MRRIPLQGTQNTRDLGGYPCEGGTTRWGVFLRSDSPHELTPADLRTLQQYGVRNTLDLRSPEECQAQPSALAAAGDFSCHQVSLSDQLLTADYEGDTPGSMAGLYITLLDDAMPELKLVMRILANAEGGTLFHCAVGKDRTGVVAMLLLSLAGVANADIVADYAITDIYMREVFNSFLKEMRGHPDFQEYRIHSAPKSMWRVLGHLYDVHGGPESYLLSAGLSVDEIDRLRGKFVDKTPLQVDF